MLFGLSAALTKPTLDVPRARASSTMLVPLAAVRARRRRHPRVRASAGVARHRPPRALGRHRVDGQSRSSASSSARCCSTRRGAGRCGTSSSPRVGLVVALVGAVVISLSSEAGKRSARATVAAGPDTRRRRLTVDCVRRRRWSPADARTASSPPRRPADPGAAPEPTGPCSVSVSQAIRSRITSRPGCGGHGCTVERGRSNTMCCGSPAS